MTMNSQGFQFLPLYHPPGASAPAQGGADQSFVERFEQAKRSFGSNRPSSQSLDRHLSPAQIAAFREYQYGRSDQIRRYSLQRDATAVDRDIPSIVALLESGIARLESVVDPNSRRYFVRYAQKTPQSQSMQLGVPFRFGRPTSVTHLGPDGSVSPEARSHRSKLIGQQVPAVEYLVKDKGGAELSRIQSLAPQGQLLGGLPVADFRLENETVLHPQAEYVPEMIVRGPSMDRIVIRRRSVSPFGRPNPKASNPAA